MIFLLIHKNDNVTFLKKPKIVNKTKKVNCFFVYNQKSQNKEKKIVITKT